MTKQEAMKRKAIELAIVHYFRTCGEMPPQKVYEWIKQNSSRQECYLPSGVELNPRYEGTWNIALAKELDTLRSSFEGALRWQYEDPDRICVSWHVDDVLGQMEGRDEELSVEEAREILRSIDLNHDACIGINWDVIDCYIDDYLWDRDKA